jgi:starvation-inducible DNA-binding protein
LPALDEHRRREIGNELQATLIELIDLSLIGKQLHWNIFGRPFLPPHEHLHELVDAWRELSDTVPERAVALGITPDGQAGTVNVNSGIESVDAGALDTDTATRELVTRLAVIAVRIRTRLDRLGGPRPDLARRPRPGDPGTGLGDKCGASQGQPGGSRQTSPKDGKPRSSTKAKAGSSNRPTCRQAFQPPG